MSSARKIPFNIELNRVIEVLANQIYQSPLALLRENTQNAFDAVALRRAIDPTFQPEIRIDVTPHTVTVTDNGIGMTAEELESNYWRAGSSGKNTPEARAAGVVGTFGIGAMANFGIAETLIIETESARYPVRTRSRVNRDELSTTDDCISLDPLEPIGAPGTSVAAVLEADTHLSVDEARNYITPFVEFVDVEVIFNGDRISGRSIRDTLPSERAAWREEMREVNLGGLAVADVELFGLANGELRTVLEQVRTLPESGRPGRAVLTQGTSAVRTLRSGFGLATISVPSAYRFGGVVDLAALRPTAGREALDDGSNYLLRRLVTAIDNAVSIVAVAHDESFENQAFLTWLVKGKRFDACGPLVARVEPGGQERRLADMVGGLHPARYYVGTDDQIIHAYASEENPLIIVSRRSPRRDCELGFLRAHGAEEVGDQPQVLRRIDDRHVGIELGAVALRVARVLIEDYFVEVVVQFGEMSHGIPLLLDRSQKPLALFIDPKYSSITTLVELYKTDFFTFGPLVKDFVRSQVFPKISDLVPSSTREGADAFLKRLRGRRELFEIDWTDREDLEAIWDRYAHGQISLSEAAQRSRVAPRRSVVVVRGDQAASISSVVPALEDSSPSDDDEFVPLPPVDRREASTDALVLTGEEGLNGYTCFLALSDRAQKENGEFFFQPHSTSVVWGGQKIFFVFQHHSGRFGLYYDVQCPDLVSADSGGGPYRTSTLLLKDRVFIPVPAELAANVTPTEGNRVRLEVRCDVLYLDDTP